MSNDALCVFGGTTKQVCGLGEARVVSDLLKVACALSSLRTVVCLKVYLFRRNLNGDFFFQNTESNQKLLKSKSTL